MLWKRLGILIPLLLWGLILTTNATRGQDAAAEATDDAAATATDDAPAAEEAASDDAADEGDTEAAEEPYVPGTLEEKFSAAELVNFKVDNLWIMIAGCLVFIMHLGFASLESGLTRPKNTVNILFKNTYMPS